MSAHRRILFFGEPATMAHVVRPVVLARALDPARYTVQLATGPDFRRLATEAGLVVRELDSIGSRAYLTAVASGRVVFPYPTLERYVADDLRHIDAFKPDLVVGDFRLSLAVSARLARVPYVGLSNAYWSPHASARMQIPVLPVTRLIGWRSADRVFRAVAPAVFAQHSLPMHRLRRRHGLPAVGLDLRRVFTEADVTLFADVPQMVPTEAAHVPGRYRYIGPVVWSPPGTVPAALSGRTDPRPLAYLALGSSGDPRLLDHVIVGLTAAGCRIALASGGAPAPATLPHDAVVADFLPGSEVAALSRLVVCNGGSPSTHQALQRGTPVLGIPANLDQLLNMQFVADTGAGLAVRADAVSPGAITAAAVRLLGEATFAQGAATVADWFGAYDSAARFASVVDALVAGPAHP